MLNKFLIACCLWAGIAFAAWAVEHPLPDPEQEARAYALFHEIRCTVCSGQSIAESPADAAADMRQAVRVRVASGDSDTAVVEYMVTRYGDGIMLWTPITTSTVLLWFGPLLLLITVSFVGWIAVKKAIAQYK